jgi:hypothetical protein
MKGFACACTANTSPVYRNQRAGKNVDTGHVSAAFFRSALASAITVDITKGYSILGHVHCHPDSWDSSRHECNERPEDNAEKKVAEDHRCYSIPRSANPKTRQHINMQHRACIHLNTIQTRSMLATSMVDRQPCMMCDTSRCDAVGCIDKYICLCMAQRIWEAAEILKSSVPTSVCVCWLGALHTDTRTDLPVAIDLQRETEEKARQPETKLSAIAQTRHIARLWTQSEAEPETPKPHTGRETSL